MRHTKSARNQRRSHHSLANPALSKCSHCGKATAPHAVCQNCGYYKEVRVIDVLAKLDKKERKKKEKELHKHEEESAEKKKELNPEELSHK